MPDACLLFSLVLPCPHFKKRAADGFLCEPCECDRAGSKACNESNGECLCKENIGGSNCSMCAVGYYKFNGRLSQCTKCNCVANRTNASGAACDESTGRCNCHSNYSGLRCEHCVVGTYQNTGSDGGCRACNCHVEGSRSPSCNILSGQCDCLAGNTNTTCSDCLEGYYKVNSTQGCKGNVGLLIENSVPVHNSRMMG